jgi:hypothetical protein
MDRVSPVVLTGELSGPHSEDAERIISMSAKLSSSQALELADIWENDSSPDYDENCAIIQAALVRTSRTLPLGWFEAVFADQEWVSSTKALHAVADAVVATLVKDEVPHAVFFSIVRPWWQYMSRNTATKVDLRKIKEICLT